MLATELIAKIQEVIDKEGNHTIFFDIPERNFYEFDCEVEGKFYQGNMLDANGRSPRIFIIFPRSLD